MTFANGSLASFGATSDPKITEAITTIGTIAAGVGASATGFGAILAGKAALDTAENLVEGAESGDPEINENIQRAKTLLKRIKDKNYFDNIGSVTVVDIKNEFQEVQRLIASEQDSDISEILKKLTSIKNDLSQINFSGKADLISDLDIIISLLSPKAAEKESSIEIYEIDVNENDDLTFTLVSPFGKTQSNEL